jgi:predicted lipoprotein with Yx(FWY)xxD motif
MMTKAHRGLGRAVVVAAIATAAMAACSSGDGSGQSAGSQPKEQASPTVATATAAKLGTVLVDDRGFTLYLLAPEKGGKIKCVDKCLDFWPPLLTSDGRSPVGGEGIDASLLGTIERPEGGTQVTYHDYPLYLFAGDEAPGQAKGQGVEKVWFAMSPDGSAAE